MKLHFPSRFQLIDEFTLDATTAQRDHLQPTLHVEIKQAVVEQLLALDQPGVHCVMAFAALRNATSSF